jgi:competence protein ComEA
MCAADRYVFREPSALSEAMKRVASIVVLFLLSAGIAAAAVNINTATKEELTSLKVRGKKRAQDIIDYRNQNRPFKSVDELEKVASVGPGLLKRIRGQITIGADKPAEKATKTKTTTIRAAAPGKTEGLKSDKPSAKMTDKLTTGTRPEQKKNR